MLECTAQELEAVTTRWRRRLDALGVVSDAIAAAPTVWAGTPVRCHPTPSSLPSAKWVEQLCTVTPPGQIPLTLLTLQLSPGRWVAAGAVGGSPAHLIQAAFVTPSGHIRCGLNSLANVAAGTGEVDCFIDQHTFLSQQCAGTAYEATVPVSGVELAGCPEPLPGPLKSATTVPYGSTVNVYNVATCTVTTTGVRCSNADPHGFSLSQQALTAF